MRAFARLRAIADFQRRNLPEIRTPEDQELLHEIGYYQVLGAPLTLKQLMRRGIGSAATTQRRLGRLKRLGIVRGHRSPADARAVELTLSPACMRAYSRLEAVLCEGSAPVHAARDPVPERHACCLCQGDAEAVDAVLEFLRGGPPGCLRLLLAPQAVVETVCAAQSALVACTGHDNPRATVEFLAAHFLRARSEGKALRVAVHSGWARERGLAFEALLRVEDELRRLVPAHEADVLCVFDGRRLAGPALVELLKAHAGAGRVMVRLR